MTPYLLILTPLLGAGVAAVWPDDRTRPWLLPAFALPHTLLVMGMLVFPPGAGTGDWLAFDAVSRAVLPAVSLLFLACAVYGVSYLHARSGRANRGFVALLLAILGLLSAGHQARHLGLLWISTEAVTLAAVPLLHFNGTPRAFEATWKYLFVGGTGIALSLLGSFCLGYASLQGGGSGDLTFVALAAQGAHLSLPWVVIAWILLLVGYGTKMGLAPMHTWKPDAYGEAPGIVGAVLAGGVTTVAFTAILRVKGVVDAAGLGGMTGRTMMAAGLFSMLVAALLVLGTRDFKRMLAYSSVEHMGILVLGASFGRAGIAASLFHVWGNSLTKGAMFLSAGNIRRAAGARTVDRVRGMASVAPRSAALFVAGLLAITACPPFGPFFSEIRILRAGLESGHWAAAGGLLAGLFVVFAGLSRLVFAVVDGRPRNTGPTGERRLMETAGVVVPPLALLVLSLAIGLYTPALLRGAWEAAAEQILPIR